MTFIIVPHEIGATTATLWVGATCEGEVSKRPMRLDLNGESHPVDGKWRKWQTFKDSDRNGFEPTDRLLHDVISNGGKIEECIHYQRVELPDLRANAQYQANLIVDNEEATGSDGRLRSCSFRTLPPKLPEAGKDTFNILLGSCFYRKCDPDGLVGKTFAKLPKGHRPHVKVLCGDQVYLDNPWRETTLKWNWSYRQPGAFRKMLLDKYIDTWTHSPDEDSGFNRLLSEGANYFCSDDHEFWNNAPSFGGVGLANTISHGRRSWWFEEGRKLFRAFQSWSTVQGFEVGNLSVKVVDTRIDRDTAGIRFMLYENLEEVRDWLSNLKGPGVLVLGQPLLKADKTESLTDKIFSFFDKDLADFGQYAELKKSICCCSHSVVVLTGDVHFARVAYLSPDSNGVTKFVEVISSPMCLVPDFFGRREHKSCDAALPLNTEPMYSKDPFQREDSQSEDCRREGPCDHFATIQFSSLEGKKVLMKVTYWPIQCVGENSTLKSLEPIEFTLD